MSESLYFFLPLFPLLPYPPPSLPKEKITFLVPLVLDTRRTKLILSQRTWMRWLPISHLGHGLSTYVKDRSADQEVSGGTCASCCPFVLFRFIWTFSLLFSSPHINIHKWPQCSTCPPTPRMDELMAGGKRKVKCEVSVRIFWSLLYTMLCPRTAGSDA